MEFTALFLVLRITMVGYEHLYPFIVQTSFVSLPCLCSAIWQSSQVQIFLLASQEALKIKFHFSDANHLASGSLNQGHWKVARP